MRLHPLVRVAVRYPMALITSTLIALIPPTFARSMPSQVSMPDLDSLAQRSSLLPPLEELSQREYTSEQISYFLEIAMGAEYVQSGSKVRKWQGDVRIQAFGAPTSADLETLRTVINEINDLTAGNIRLQLVSRNPNVTVRFVPEWQFKRYEPNYDPINYGFFWTQWNNNTIDRANILITTQGVTQKERSHLIREELTQALGLMKDSYRYPDSMFYQPWTDITQYSAIDKALIKMLYDPKILPGMTQAQVIDAFNSLQAKDQSAQCESKKALSVLSFALNSDCAE